jgi:hypothetical protein
MEFRFGGGVVPRGAAEFLSPTHEKLNANQLQLVILDKTKLSNGRPDYDAIGIRWKGNVFRVTMQDDLVYPLMKFIKRGSFIAFTVPMAGFDEAYFTTNALIEVTNVGGFVAKEFLANSHASFLEDVDLDTTDESMPSELEKMIKGDVNKGNGKLGKVGSYVNCDFHVKYQVFLEDANGHRVADVGGLPLRYYYNVATDGSAIVDGVGVFTFPSKEFDIQYRAVLFFQAAAILRQFSQDNPKEFDRFMKEVGDALEVKR